MQLKQFNAGPGALQNGPLVADRTAERPPMSTASLVDQAVDAYREANPGKACTVIVSQFTNNVIIQNDLNVAVATYTPTDSLV